MAEGIQFVCEHCGKKVEAWSDGNPYFFDSQGKKQYAYHPSNDFARCIGNDSPHLCLDCGELLVVDSRAANGHCPECKSPNIVPTFSLGGHPCPACKLGVFLQDPEFFLIS